MGFIKKVFGILAVMLTVTALFVMAPMFIKPVENYMKDVRSKWLLWPCSAITLVCMISLYCFPKIARSVPTNYILLGVFCLCQSWSVACLTVEFKPESVLIAAAITAFMTIGLSMYAIFTKTDFTWYVALLWSFCFIVLICTILSIFYHSMLTNIMISALVVFCVSLYIIVDIQLITGVHACKYSLDDYVVAAMSLYIDIIRLFLEILRILSEANVN